MSEVKEYQIQDEFINETLWEYSEYLFDLLVDSIQDKNLINTGYLLNYLQSNNIFNIYERGAHFLEIKFPDYGRLMEINYHKRIQTQKDIVNPLRVNTTAKWKKEKSKNKQKHKNTQWYTRNVYGSFNYLLGKLMYGLSDEIRESLIEKIKGREK